MRRQEYGGQGKAATRAPGAVRMASGAHPVIAAKPAAGLFAGSPALLAGAAYDQVIGVAVDPEPCEKIRRLLAAQPEVDAPRRTPWRSR